MELCDHIDFSGSLTCNMGAEERKSLSERIPTELRNIMSFSAGRVLAGGRRKQGEAVVSSLTSTAQPQVPVILICPMCPANCEPVTPELYSHFVNEIEAPEHNISRNSCFTGNGFAW